MHVLTVRHGVCFEASGATERLRCKARDYDEIAVAEASQQDCVSGMGGDIQSITGKQKLDGLWRRCLQAEEAVIMVMRHIAGLQSLQPYPCLYPYTPIPLYP